VAISRPARGPAAGCTLLVFVVFVVPHQDFALPGVIGLADDALLLHPLH